MRQAPASSGRQRASIHRVQSGWASALPAMLTQSTAPLSTAPAKATCTTLTLFIDSPLSVCAIYATFDLPEDRLINIYNADITATDPEGFFQHPLGFTPYSAPCGLIPSFPDLVCDSFVTIGVECGPFFPLDGTTVDDDFDAVEFEFSGHLVGGWFNSVPVNGQGDAGNYPDKRILLAQLSLSPGVNAVGVLSPVYLFGGGPNGPITIEDQYIDCRAAVCLGSACPADVNSDGTVGAFDLATLLGAWGPCDNGLCLCLDSDADGQIGPADLTQLLGNWGACP